MTKFENVPAYLKRNGLFCLWRYETANGRKTKIPYDPNNPQRKGDPSEPATFSTLDTAAAASTGFDGIGVGIFDNVAAIDIDHCISGGQLSDMAADIVQRMDTYTEKSPSGEGLRLFFLVPSDFKYDKDVYYINNQKRGLEVYLPGMTSKYCTITGDTILTCDMVDRADRLQPIIDKYMKRPTAPQPTTPAAPPALTDISDSDLIEKAMAAANGATFSELWNGGLCNYPSNSEADLALCNLLAFWTGRDAGRMKRLFLQSGLSRQGGGKYRNPAQYDKYLDKTIEKAIVNCKEVYTPRQTAQDAPQAANRGGEDKRPAPTEKPPQAIKQATGRAAVDEFLAAIQTEKYKPIPTEIKPLDNMLNGGFMAETIVFLGAEPGAGKTALASMIFESMAAAGHDGIFYNLEMSREQLLARSLARMIYTQNHAHKLTALEVLQLYKQGDYVKELVMAAGEEYKQKIADHLEYVTITTDVTAILTDMNERAEAAIKAGKPAPNVCLDYLQIMTGNGREDAAEIIKRAVSGLKEYARRYHAVVLIVMAQSRGVNARSEATLAAGRDTSAIEYGADLQLQLVKDEKNNRDRVNLSVTKSRFTQTKMNKEGMVFIFRGGQSYFEYTSEKWNTDRTAVTKAKRQ